MTKYSVLGAGAVGSWIAAHLRRNGVDVSFVGRNGKHMSTVYVEELFSQGQQWNAKVPHYDEGMISNLLICTKAFDAERAVVPLKHRIASDASIIITCNGMGVFEEVKQVLGPSRRYFNGILTHGMYRKDARVVHAGNGGMTIGPSEETDVLIDEGLKKVLEHIPGAVIENRYTEMRRLMFLKLCVNCAINPVTALLKCTNGRLLEDRAQFEGIVLECAYEISELMKMEGIECNVGELVDMTIRVAEDTCNNYSSMCSDMLNSRCTEIDYINGYVLRNLQHSKFNSLMVRLVKLKEISEDRHDRKCRESRVI